MSVATQGMSVSRAITFDLLKLAYSPEQVVIHTVNTIRGTLGDPENWRVFADLNVKALIITASRKRGIVAKGVMS